MLGGLSMRDALRDSRAREANVAESAFAAPDRGSTAARAANVAFPTFCELSLHLFPVIVRTVTESGRNVK